MKKRKVFVLLPLFLIKTVFKMPRFCIDLALWLEKVSNNPVFPE